MEETDDGNSRVTQTTVRRTTAQEVAVSIVGCAGKGLALETKGVKHVG